MENKIALQRIDIENKILVIRGEQVIIDRDLAKFYGVATKVLNQAVKRNIERFPEEFCFQLNKEEFENWKSQFVTSNSDKMGLRRPPYAFTEQGVAMLSAVLKSDTAIVASIQIITPEATPRCFDKDRDGLVIGEGAGTLILEDLEHAVKRGAKIFCEVAGFATNADGFHITSPNYYTQGICMEAALANANITSDDIGYVNAHGTATYYGDISETTAVHNVFQRPVPISSTKSYVGHLLGACGAVESWITINMMNENWYHPNINLDELDPQCAPLGYIKGQGMEMDCEYVMSNNFAFGGINTSLIFKKFK